MRNNEPFFNANLMQCNMCKNELVDNIINCKIYSDDAKPYHVLSSKKECNSFSSQTIIKFENLNKTDEMFLGGVFGHVVGDTLGVPVEFKSRRSLKEDPVKGMRAFGTYNQYFGTWSDDSSLALCLTESLTKGYDLDNIAEKFIDFFIKGYLTPFGDVFDIGSTTVSAINKMIIGINPVDCGGKDEYDNGNGSLMRILPMAYFTLNMEVEEKIKLVEEVSSLTHKHKRSILACIIFNEMAINLLKKQDKMEAYENVVKFTKEYLIEDYKDEIQNYKRIVEENIWSFKEEEISSSGYVISTLEASLWCFLTSDSYEETVLKAVNLGDDTDTIGAIVGGLAGIYYGISSIPNNWIQILAEKETIYKIIIEFQKSLEK